MAKIRLLTILLLPLLGLSNDISIEISINEQRLYVLKGSLRTHSYAISTSSYGEGSTANSFKTPLGMHSIQSMIGEGAEVNTIFKSRINTQRQAEVIHDHIDTENDYVTSRILWLTGEEQGKNAGSGIDSYSRYIYIHGTQEEGLIGTKASHGCIRMFNDDVIKLYNIVNKGTKVNILI
ncbi:L,D-transpeptidase [Gammaproteobacteria bacterium]|nr:L,D-transpeptidase [Gammaproteobacteria bacterium]MDA7786340.1 L,D-transpeptidase [Gammaproteobacteria bacterium]MDA7802304.1 L,D-transpeptidase [Gammaproteobacteria bacterium]MDA7818698.1 L,D-transpeptidase [Gammaproteobacteria bacterium]MDA7856317.1 L,D-transpeptidase [Gammaproteobacteria bacterium]|tara:strand:+ start:20049 stop:20585 length:537 start_codon:yes stop_codon:yes gene_type:complete